MKQAPTAVQGPFIIGCGMTKMTASDQTRLTALPGMHEMSTNCSTGLLSSEISAARINVLWAHAKGAEISLRLQISDEGNSSDDCKSACSAWA
jgi:hypothetical protein